MYAEYSTAVATVTRSGLGPRHLLSGILPHFLEGSRVNPRTERGERKGEA